MINLQQEKTVILKTEIRNTLDISNLLELAISSIGCSKDRINRYTLLIEEALCLWRETLPAENQLSVERSDTTGKVQFTFSIEGPRQNPFHVAPKKGDEFSMINVTDRLLSGVGNELHYSYKKGVNKITLTLPKANIEERLLRRNVAVLMVPLTLQALMSSIATNVDTLMLGFLNASAMSGVALASVFVTLMGQLLASISQGSTATMVQYWGRRDRDGVNQLVSLTMILALISSLLFFIVSFLFPVRIMSLYSNDQDIILEGAMYLRWLSPSFILSAVYTMFFSYLHTLDNVKKTVLFSIIGCSCNVLFNAIFIFGLFGVSALGARGAALATDLSSLVQVILGIYELQKQDKIQLRFCLRYTINLKAFFSSLISIFSSGMIWIIACNIINAAIGHMGKDIVSVNSLLLVLSGFVLCVQSGFGKSVGLILGVRIGSGQTELAKEQSGYAVKFCFQAAAFAVPIFLFAGYIMRFLPVDLSASALEYFTPMMLFYGVHVFFAVMNGMLVIGILYPGGDSKAVFVIDMIVLWCILVPVSIAVPHITFLPPVALAILLRADELLSFPMKYFRYRKYKWLSNITKET